MKSSLWIVSRREVGDAAWDAFVDHADEAWLWHRTVLQDALLTWPGRSDESCAFIDAKGEIEAILPLQRIRRPLFRGVCVSLLESFGGIACRNALGDRTRRSIYAAASDWLEQRAAGALEIRFALPPMAPAYRGAATPLVSPLVALDCINTPSQTWVVHLAAGAEEVWRRLEGRARTAVRKAERAGATVREAAGPADLEQYYRLHQETYRRTGATTHPRAYFAAIWRDLLPAGLARVWIAEADGRAVAAESFALYKGAGLYWTGAANKRGLELDANSLIQWRAMRWMADNGVEWYETGEAFPGARDGKRKGLNDFKRSFGGRLHPFYRGALDGRGWAARFYRAFDAARG